MPLSFQCRPNDSLLGVSDPNGHANKGFALIISLSLMAFLVLLLLSLSTLIQLGTSQANHESDSLKARQSAQLAMGIAMGKIQRSAGPDQRSTARADINVNNTGNPMWIGVWDTTPPDLDNPTHAAAPTDDSGTPNNEPILWLVNDDGTDPTPDDSPVADPASSNTNVWLLETVFQLPVEHPIKVASTTINNAGQFNGRYAFWADDLSLKSQTSPVPAMASPASGSDEQLQQNTVAPSFGVDQIAEWNSLFSLTHSSSAQGDQFREHLKQIDRYSELSLLDAVYGDTVSAASMADSYSDMTPYSSQGVLSDTLRGGLRRDLTPALTQGTAPTQEPALSEVGPGVQLSFGNTTSGGVELFPEPGPAGAISPHNSLTWTNGAELPTMTWDQVRSALQSPADASGQADAIFAPFPTHDQYNISTSSTQARLPIVTMIEFRFGIDVDESFPNFRYAVEPVAVLTNPYNTTLRSATYQVQFTTSGSTPGIEFNIIPHSSFTGPDPSFGPLQFITQFGNKTLSFQITDSFLPGEVKVYSLSGDTVTDSSSNGEFTLEPGYTASSLLVDTGTAIPDELRDTTTKIELSSSEQLHPTIAIGAPGEFPSISARHTETEPNVMDIKFKKEDPSQKNPSKPFGRMDGSPSTLGLITFRFSMTNPKNGYLSSGNQPGTANHRVPVGHPARRSDGGTIGEKTAGMRSYIDANPRAVVSQRLGGWDSTPLYYFESMRDADYTIPSFDFVHGFWGGSQEDDGDGTSTVILFDVPRENDPIVSIGQLSTVNWGLDGKHPTYPLGNSFASIFYYSDQPDLSFALNEALWDRFFFSTLPASGLDARPTPLDNTRLAYFDGDESADLSTLEGDPAYSLAATRLMIDGAFNINSTSIDAWTAFLASVPQNTYGYRSADNSTQTAPDTRPYLRLRRTHNGNPAQDQYQSYEWSGYRQLSDTQLKEIATAIVAGIQERGRPARSLAEFLNRDLNFPATDPRNQKGILQAAIDQVVNEDDPTASNPGRDELQDLPGLVGSNGISNPLIVETTFVNGDNPDAARGKLRTTGAPGFLMQNDVITPLAPSMTARSDTFLIRTYGDYRDPVTDELRSRVWCEAVVQRTPQFTGTDDAQTRIEDLPANGVSERFGRKFIATQFQWLSEQEK